MEDDIAYPRDGKSSVARSPGSFFILLTQLHIITTHTPEQREKLGVIKKVGWFILFFEKVSLKVADCLVLHWIKLSVAVDGTSFSFHFRPIHFIITSTIQHEHDKTLHTRLKFSESWEFYFFGENQISALTWIFICDNCSTHAHKLLLRKKYIPSFWKTFFIYVFSLEICIS